MVLLSNSYREITNTNSSGANVDIEEPKSRAIYLRNLADLMYKLNTFQNQHFLHVLTTFQREAHLDTSCITESFSLQSLSNVLTQGEVDVLL